MKGSKPLIAVTIALSLAIIPSAIAAPKTTNKAAGRVTTVVNTILNGVGIPAKTVGINGDFYIDTKNLNLYGPKTKGIWKTGTSLKQAEAKSITTIPGEGGATGDKGAQGDKGDKGATGSTGATGPAGLSGAPGASGAAGAKGDDGANGAAGSSGPQGANGSSGPAGATGSAGTKGDTGLTGSKGDTGTTGTQGIKGDAGMSTGLQSVITFDAPFTGTAGATKSSIAFGNFLPGKNYILRVLISTYDVNQSSSNYGLGFGIATTAGTAIISSNYVVMNGSQYAGTNRTYISIVADIVLNGAADISPYSLIVTLTSGANGGASISASGTFTKIEVGSIG